MARSRRRKKVFPGHPSLRKSSRNAAPCWSAHPSDNLDENHSCHEKAKTTIDHYRSDRRFDLATLRMVAEHIEEPDAALAVLAVS